METVTNILVAVVRKAGLGDAKAREALYHQYSKGMFSICVRMTGNRADAQDVLQEAFMKAFNNLHQLKDENNFGGWLRRIVVNECIGFTKKNKSWQELQEHHEEKADDYEFNWLEGIGFERIHEEIKKLPACCREVFTLYVTEDYSHKQIAEALGVTESTSRSQYHRARQLLKQRLLLLVKHG
ncbi:MAG TPA: sigma-70 family RNA polymerase sigma factor [Chitinophagaceae bacterium]|nr:sigma-70 family RNA polymerase sigma factor [Chitinophagaceae bacterium]